VLLKIFLLPHWTVATTQPAAQVSGTYVSHGQVRMVAAPILATLILPPFLDTDLPEPVNFPAGIDPSPPELPGTWQFVVRTALQPRAPSFVS
jgi:hypothetical protein